MRYISYAETQMEMVVLVGMFAFCWIFQTLKGYGEELIIMTLCFSFLPTSGFNHSFTVSFLHRNCASSALLELYISFYFKIKKKK